MEYDNATIILDKELYNKLVLKKDIIVNSNLITKEISKQLLSQFALDNNFYSVCIYLDSIIKKRIKGNSSVTCGDSSL